MARSLFWNPDQKFRASTTDGATIALGRYAPRGPCRFIEPVVLSHGLFANRFDLDFDERYSLAQYLAKRGFETWVLEMRGRGHAGFHGRATTFDDQANYDVEAALREIGKPVLWVGHSKGGLVAYAHLARNPQAPIRGIVTLGAPVRFAVDWRMKLLANALAPFAHLPLIPIRAASRVMSFKGLPPEPIASHLVNPENLHPDVVKQALYNVSADVFGGVARQFLRWIQSGRFDGNDGFDYFAGLERIGVPVLLVAGSKDKLAPTEAVFAAAEKFSAPSELFVAEGYGHGDLSVGMRAPDEIFPKVAQFLERVGTRANASLKLRVL